MFYGRNDILDRLMSLFKKRTSSLVTCRGRRRIGKSTLIEAIAVCAGFNPEGGTRNYNFSIAGNNIGRWFVERR